MNKNKRKSFTLIEVLITIIIIGIMTSFIFFNTDDALKQRDKLEILSFVESLKGKNLDVLVSEWNFEGPTQVGSWATNNDVKDSWGYNNGDIAGHAPKVRGGEDCVFGKCLEFDGSNYVEIKDSSSLNFGSSEFTISMWAKMNTHSDVTPLITKSGSCSAWGSKGYAFTTIVKPDQVYFMWAGNGCGVYTGLEDPDASGFNWKHLTGIRREITSGGVCTSYAEFYMDGKYIGRESNGTCDLSIDNTANLYIGKKANCTGLVGLIDDVQIYKKALSISEINESYMAGLNSMIKTGTISKEEYNQRILNLAKK